MTPVGVPHLRSRSSPTPTSTGANRKPPAGPPARSSARRSTSPVDRDGRASEPPACGAARPGIPVALYAFAQRNTDFGLQGRYGLPLFALIPVVAGVVIQNNVGSRPAALVTSVRARPRRRMRPLPGRRVVGERPPLGRRRPDLPARTIVPPGGWWLWASTSPPFPGLFRSPAGCRVRRDVLSHHTFAESGTQLGNAVNRLWVPAGDHHSVRKRDRRDLGRATGIAPRRPGAFPRERLFRPRDAGRTNVVDYAGALKGGGSGRFGSSVG
jgi:hypothetical protein